MIACGAFTFVVKSDGGSFTCVVDHDEYAVYTTPDGEAKVIDAPGTHWIWGCRVATYPYRTSVECKDAVVIFNDGKKRKIGAVCVMDLPTQKYDRIDLHIKMAGDAKNIEELVNSFYINVAKSTGYTMSGDEVIESRRTEFAELICRQMFDGIYKYRITEQDGEFKTEVVMSVDNKPLIAMPSQWSDYEINCFKQF